MPKLLRNSNDLRTLLSENASLVLRRDSLNYNRATDFFDEHIDVDYCSALLGHIVSAAAVSLMKIDIVRMWVPEIDAANPLHHNYHFQGANAFSVFFTPFLIIGLLFGVLGLILKRYAH